MTSAVWAQASSAPVQEHHPPQKGAQGSAQQKVQFWAVPAWRNRVHWSEQSPVSPQYDEGTFAWPNLQVQKPHPKYLLPAPNRSLRFSSIPACPVSCPHHSLLRDPPSPGNALKQLTERAKIANP